MSPSRPSTALFYRPRWTNVFLDKLKIDVPERLPDDHQEITGAGAVRRSGKDRGWHVVVMLVDGEYWACRVTTPIPRSKGR